MDQATGLRGILKEGGKPYGSPDVSADVLQKDNSTKHTVRVISVTSGKGGVGKTNVVANLALALRKLGKRVLVLDADLGLANMDVLLGLNPRYTIHHVLKGEKRLEEVMIAVPSGFKLLPAASGIQELTDLDPSQRLFLLNEFDALQEHFDVFLIDTGAGISANVMYFNFAAMEKVVIVTNEPTSLTDAYALIKVLTNQYSQKRFKVLVNAARNRSEAERIYRHLSLVVDQFLGSPSLDYLGWIPFDKQVSVAVRQQQMVLQKYPNTPASKSIMELAERLMESEDGTDLEGDIKFFWQKLLGS
ncbi:MAG: MinD/ParA family protein [Deltaproteobacteria bacterium]|nr:MinD/ParA family protein [Deltaproteobacteria bacterium]MBW2015427.1 MinD/ParA family protein [Deltaproteobacteria bacterium]MBW2129181.1 MinD/ParA family protein [Deltaproteobacteria bacterium]MBW2302795.1 MinD/ParA family protein [Deltaproteobacteria bacterium]